MDKVTSLLSRREEPQEVPRVGGEVLALRDGLDRWLDRFFEEPWGLPAVGGFRPVPRVTIQDTNDAVIVSADVPGFDRDDLQVTATPDALTIRGETRQRSADRREGPSVAEDRFEQFTEIVSLPPGLDIDGAEAEVQRGRLTLKIPKVTPGPRGRRIPITT